MIAIALNQAAMRAQLEVMFGGLPAELCDGRIELAWTDPEDGRLNHARLFGLDELEKMAQVAASINAVPGKSLYVGASLRKPKTAKSRRATDADFYALTCAYADFDGPGDLDRAEALCREKGVEPSFKVYTGRHPHARAQFWFRLQEPQCDPEACRKLNRAIADALGGDVSVVNPGRVMRLGGSIAWPRKKGRIIELTEFVLPEGAA
ncbi:MAG TPA: hypothetical protein DCZ01_11330 [Elusimicrobia bacterium]|nr:MAG: hypothetical protein A2X40_03475 [Elusimicrobia bacterium GWC2_65_9]OHC65919.1 MAG: hypothetical protein A2040_13125 [Rhodocyclales bacterium GWA2_65_19]HAZ09084.1 hypothetical protein [Elusimicrobiota bacterium]